MRTLLQCLIDYPDALIEAIAYKRGVALAAGDRRTAIDQLSAILVDPESLQAAVAASSPEASDAVRELLGRGGRTRSARFARSYGPIRTFGPARLRRETPWDSPLGAAEELWYSGLISKGFAPIMGKSVEIIFIPTDILPHLGLEAASMTAFSVPMQPAPTTPVLSADAFIEDMCTLLSTADTQRLPVDHRGNWTDKAVAAVNERMILHDSSHGQELLRTGTPIALLVHLARQLGWLETGQRQVRLRPTPVQAWLEADRQQQSETLWAAWKLDPEWDDLCRTPGLRCEGTWSHQPHLARQSVLRWLQECTPGIWYRITDFVAAVKDSDTEFLRPEGNYDSWYIRDLSSGQYLRGFGQWDNVEGRLIAYIIMGPAHWMSETMLGVVGGEGSSIRHEPDLSWLEHKRRSNLLFSLPVPGRTSMHCLTEDNQGSVREAVTILPDFRMQVPPTTEAIDRFRIGRFADWKASQPVYEYRITKRSLARAEQRGIEPTQISNFVARITDDRVPPNVTAALHKWKVH